MKGTSFLTASIFLFTIARAAVLFEGGTIISYDEVNHNVKVLKGYSMLVEKDKISAIYDASKSRSLPTGTEIVSAAGKILSPGFIDTHRHGWQTAFKTLGSNSTLADYVLQWSEHGPAGTRFTAEDVYYSQLIGLHDAIDAGVTGILEHAHCTFSNETSRASLQASVDSGLRIWWAYAFHELSNGFSVEEQLANFRDLYEKDTWNNSAVEMAIGYDLFDRASEEQSRQIIKLAIDYNVSALTTHYLGGSHFAFNSPQLLNQLGLLNIGIPIIFSHGTEITTQDILLLREHNHYVSITPESEMHYGIGFPHGYKIQDQAALGVDTNFAFSSSIITQARTWLQVVRKQLTDGIVQAWKVPSNSPMSVNQAFLMATRNGGRAMGRDDVGVLKVGAKADIVVFDAPSANFLGWRDPVAAIILHSHPGNIEHVMVDGQFLKRNFSVVTLDGSHVNITEARERFLESADRIQKLWLNDPPELEQGQNGAGIPYVTLDRVDVIAGEGIGY